MRRILALILIAVMALILTVHIIGTWPALAGYAAQYDAGQQPTLFADWAGLEQP